MTAADEKAAFATQSHPDNTDLTLECTCNLLDFCLVMSAYTMLERSVIVFLAIYTILLLV